MAMMMSRSVSAMIFSERLYVSYKDINQGSQVLGKGGLNHSFGPV